MAKEYTVVTRLVANTANFKKGMQDATGSIKKTDSKIRGFAKGIGAVAVGAVAGLTVAAGVAGVAIGKLGIDFNAMMEQSQIAWETLLGGAEEAKKMIEDLKEMGAKTPFEFDGLDKSAKLLKAMGVNADEIIPYLTTLGDSVSAVGGNQDQLNGLSMAIGQMLTKGKVSAEEMNQLAERGIPAWEIMSREMGISKQELMEMSSQGKILADEAVPALVKGLDEDFGGAMERQSKTFNGMKSTIMDNVKMISASLSQGLFANIKKILPSIIGFTDRLQSALDEGGIKGAFEEFLPASVVNFIIGGFNSIKDGVSLFYGQLTSVWGSAKALFAQIAPMLQPIRDKFAEIFDGSMGVVKQFWANVLPFIQTMIEGLTSFWAEHGDKLVAAWLWAFGLVESIVKRVLGAVVPFVKTMLDQIKQFWDENGTQIIQAVTNAFNIIKGIIDFVMPAVLFIVDMVLSNIIGVFKGALNIIMGAVKIFAGIFTGDFSKIWEGVKQLFSGAIEFIWNLINLLMFGKILGAIKGFGVKAIGFFQGFWTKSVAIFKSLDDVVFGVIKKFTSKITGSIGKLVSNVRSSFDTMRAFGGKIFSSMWQAIQAVVSKIYRGVVDKISSMVTGVKDKFSGLLTSAKGNFNKIKDAIINPIETAKNAVSKAIDKIKGFFKGIKTKIPMPHFKMTGKLDLNPVGGMSVPKFSVDWYKNGGLMTKPTMFGMNGNRPMVGGEAGAEAIIPLKDSVLSKIGSMIAKTMDLNLTDNLMSFLQSFNPATIANAVKSGISSTMSYSPVSIPEGSNNSNTTDNSVNIHIKEFHGGATKEDGENIAKYVKDYIKRSGR